MSPVCIVFLLFSCLGVCVVYSINLGFPWKQFEDRRRCCTTCCMALIDCSGFASIRSLFWCLQLVVAHQCHWLSSALHLCTDLIVSLAVMCLRTSATHGWQVRCTCGQPAYIAVKWLYTSTCLIVALAIMCLRTSVMHGWQVRCTCGQPANIRSQVTLHFDLLGCYTTLLFS